MASPKHTGGAITKYAKLDYIIMLIVGICIGTSFTHIHYVAKESSIKRKTPSTGFVKQLSETPVRSTSHVDDTGRPITKQQLLEPFVLPNLVGFSIATFLPGQTMMPPHEHETLYEIFYVVEGEIISSCVESMTLIQLTQYFKLFV